MDGNKFELRIMSTVPRTSASAVSSKNAAASKPASAPVPQKRTSPCTHPKVQVVSRDDDAEYVECLECGDVFDSEEFQDIAIEESTEKEKELDDE